MFELHLRLLVVTIISKISLILLQVEILISKKGLSEQVQLKTVVHLHACMIRKFVDTRWLLEASR